MSHHYEHDSVQILFFQNNIYCFIGSFCEMFDWNVCLCWSYIFKGIIHTKKIKIVSSFTRPYEISNPYYLLSSVEHKNHIKYVWKMSHCFLSIQLKSMVTKTVWLLMLFKISNKSYRFGKTWGWVNDDTIFISGWTMSLGWTFVSIHFLGPLYTVYVQLFPNVWDHYSKVHLAFFSNLMKFFIVNFTINHSI